MNFSLEDFFSTDVAMPSSPPKAFHLYEDPMTMTEVDWNEFHEFDASPVKKGVDAEHRIAKTAEVKKEPNAGQESAVVQLNQPSKGQTN